MYTDEQKQQWTIRRKFEIRDYLNKLGHSFDNTNEINMHMKISPSTKIKSIGKQKFPGTPNPGKGSVGPQMNAKGPTPVRQSPTGSYPTLGPTSGVNAGGNSPVTPQQQGPGGVYPAGQVTPPTQTPVAIPTKPHKFAQPSKIAKAPKRRLV